MHASPHPSECRRRQRVRRSMPLVVAIAVLPALLQAGAHRNSGTLDPVFGTGGMVTTDVSGQEDLAVAMAVTPRGQIVVAGYVLGPGPGNLDVALARYDPDGTLDPSFGTDGRVVTDLGAVEVARSVAITRQGRIIVAGATSRSAGATDVLLLGYDASGHLDQGFGEDGVVVADLFGPDEGALDMAAMADGHIVVAGTVDFSAVGPTADFGIARFDPDGSLDTSFGVGGTARVDFGGSDFVAALAAHPSGAIVVAGTTLSATGDYDLALARLTRDGRLDPAFGSAGLVTTDFQRLDLASDVAIMPNGAIVLVGSVPLGIAGSDFLVVRYLRSGALDPSFGDAGRVTTDVGLGNDFAAAVQVRAEGTIVVAGRTNRSEFPAPPTFDNFALAQYDRHGELDRGFGTGGLVITDFGGSNDEARALAFVPGGRLVVAGQRWDGQHPTDFALAAYR